MLVKLSGSMCACGNRHLGCQKNAVPWVPHLIFTWAGMLAQSYNNKHDIRCLGCIFKERLLASCYEFMTLERRKSII